MTNKTGNIILTITILLILIPITNALSISGNCSGADVCTITTTKYTAQLDGCSIDYLVWNGSTANWANGKQGAQPNYTSGLGQIWTTAQLLYPELTTTTATTGTTSEYINVNCTATSDNITNKWYFYDNYINLTSSANKTFQVGNYFINETAEAWNLTTNFTYGTLTNLVSYGGVIGISFPTLGNYTLAVAYNEVTNSTGWRTNATETLPTMTIGRTTTIGANKEINILYRIIPWNTSANGINQSIDTLKQFKANPNFYDIRGIGDVYHTATDVDTILQTMAAANPEYMDYKKIGETYEGRDIYIYRVGNKSSGRFMFDGRTHGPEDCGTENGLEFINWTLTNGSEDAESVKNNNYLLFIPLVNKDTLRRQSMRRNYTYSNGTTINITDGIDLNRNFPIGWSTSGSGDPTNDYDYYGPVAASEYETQAVINALNLYRPDVYLNVHCGGTKLLRYSNSTARKNDIVSNISAFDTEYSSTATATYGNGAITTGGYVVTTAANYTQGNGWMLENVRWEELPSTLKEYKENWYTKVFPIYLAMSEATNDETRCVENWTATYTTCTHTQRTKYYTDENTCNSIIDLPTDNGTSQTCLDAEGHTEKCVHTPNSSLMNAICMILISLIIISAVFRVKDQERIEKKLDVVIQSLVMMVALILLTWILNLLMTKLC